MSEMFNRTLLWSGANTSSCNLSEPAQNFQYLQVALPTEYCIVPTYSAVNKAKFGGAASYWTSQSYLDWQYQYSITNSGKTLTINNFQMIQQVASSAPSLLGSAGNRASNLKHISQVWGLNRVSGTPTSAIGVPYSGAGWRAYDETLLASSNTNVSSLTLSEPASAFNRIRVTVGVSSESQNSFEYNSPDGDNDKLTVKSYWGNTTGINKLVLSRYVWLSGTTVLSSFGGKSFAVGWNSANPWTGTGSTANENYRWRPVYAVYGINRK